MISLSRGQKIKLADLTSATKLQARLELKSSGLNFDLSCFGLDDSGQLSDDRYFIFFNQKEAPQNEIVLASLSAHAARFDLDLARLPQTVRRLVFVATVDGAGQMSGLQTGRFVVSANGKDVGEFAFIGSDFSSEKAVMVAEIYFKSEWRVAAIGQGFKAGLNAVLKHFGGQEAETAPVSPLVLLSTQQQAVPMRVTPPLLSANANNRCSDCGKLLNLIDRGRNSLAGDRRCGACDKLVKQQAQIQAQRQAQAQIALRQQLIQRIIDGELPTIAPQDAGVVLKRGEVCHHVTPAEFYEERVTSTVRVGHGAGARIRICRGVTYRVGATQGKTIPITGMVRIDGGRLLLTNQRCVFDGQKKSFSVMFGKIISFEPFTDGLELNAESKKTQQYKLRDGELAAAILSTALNL